MNFHIRWQLDGHGGEEGTLVVEAFPKLCLAAGEQMIEVNIFDSNLRLLILKLFLVAGET